ncbi:MAG: hypothetical protein Q8L37_01505 [Candidatus Gottesmanbacteria bacterium]|nr:hypothetical protein [Candidatus Gottesmanbacteria bacterium]
MPRQTWQIAFDAMPVNLSPHPAGREVPECVVVAVYSPVAAGGITIVSPIDQAR